MQNEASEDIFCLQITFIIINRYKIFKEEKIYILLYKYCICLLLITFNSFLIPLMNSELFYLCNIKFKIDS